MLAARHGGISMQVGADTMRRNMPLGLEACNTSAMSSILDALKKSESARLRNDHPAMFDAPRERVRTTRVWIPALIVLLLVNLIVVAFALLRTTPAPVAAERSIAAAEVDGDDEDPNVAPTAASRRALPPRAAAKSPAAGAVSVARATTNDEVAVASVPTISRDDLLASGLSVPEVNLGLHVYDPNPAARFVFLNGQKLGEGGVSREGLRVTAISARATVLEYRGSRFTVGTELP
ncbi:MAG: hypothetical protein EBZ40_02410 [Gammaproteobacteria bacterium]|nr:hypothetical protein [Gammaproteobacteria bacterium]